jgi:hypothetical protein
MPAAPPAESGRLAALAEAVGFDAVRVPDERFYRDCFVTLAAVAQATRRVRLGPCVTDPYEGEGGDPGSPEEPSRGARPGRHPEAPPAPRDLPGRARPTLAEEWRRGRTLRNVRANLAAARALSETWSGKAYWVRPDYTKRVA